MKINYMVWRYKLINGLPVYSGRDKAKENIRGQLDISMDWEGSHLPIIEAIRAKHPGYSLHGYCMTPEEGEV